MSYRCYCLYSLFFCSFLFFSLPLNELGAVSVQTESVQVKAFFTTVLYYLIGPTSGMIHGTRLSHCDLAWMWKKVCAEKAHDCQQCDENAMRTLRVRGKDLRQVLPFCASASSNELPFNAALGSVRRRSVSMAITSTFFIPHFRLWSHQSSLCSESHAYKLTK